MNTFNDTVIIRVAKTKGRFSLCPVDWRGAGCLVHGSMHGREFKFKIGTAIVVGLQDE